MVILMTMMIQGKWRTERKRVQQMDEVERCPCKGRY